MREPSSHVERLSQHEDGHKKFVNPPPPHLDLNPTLAVSSKACIADEIWNPGRSKQFPDCSCCCFLPSRFLPVAHVLFGKFSCSFTPSLFLLHDAFNLIEFCNSEGHLWSACGHLLPDLCCCPELHVALYYLHATSTC
jgi:hypothetical protein